MGRIFKLIVVLIVLGLIALTAYSYLADMHPETSTITEPVILHAD